MESALFLKDSETVENLVEYSLKFLLIQKYAIHAPVGINGIYAAILNDLCDGQVRPRDSSKITLFTAKNMNLTNTEGFFLRPVQVVAHACLYREPTAEGQGKILILHMDAAVRNWDRIADSVYRQVREVIKSDREYIVSDSFLRCFETLSNKSAVALARIYIEAKTRAKPWSYTKQIEDWAAPTYLGERFVDRPID